MSDIKSLKSGEEFRNELVILGWRKRNKQMSRFEASNGNLTARLNFYNPSFLNGTDWYSCDVSIQLFEMRWKKHAKIIRRYFEERAAKVPENLPGEISRLQTLGKLMAEGKTLQINYNKSAYRELIGRDNKLGSGGSVQIMHDGSLNSSRLKSISVSIQHFMAEVNFDQMMEISLDDYSISDIQSTAGLLGSIYVNKGKSEAEKFLSELVPHLQRIRNPQIDVNYEPIRAVVELILGRQPGEELEG